MTPVKYLDETDLLSRGIEGWMAVALLAEPFSKLNTMRWVSLLVSFYQTRFVDNSHEQFMLSLSECM